MNLVRAVCLSSKAMAIAPLFSYSIKLSKSISEVCSVSLSRNPSEGYRRTQEVSGWQGGVSRSAAVQVFMDRMLMHPVLGYLAKDNPKRSYCAPKAKSAHP